MKPHSTSYTTPLRNSHQKSAAQIQAQIEFMRLMSQQRTPLNKPSRAVAIIPWFLVAMILVHGLIILFAIILFAIAL